jgi:hypothetical protein
MTHFGSCSLLGALGIFAAGCVGVVGPIADEPDSRAPAVPAFTFTPVSVTRLEPLTLPRDAGDVDAGDVDAGSIGDAGVYGPDGGRTAVPCVASLLCDDFESYASTLAGPWTPDNGLTGSSLQVDSTNVFSGTKSVPIKSGGGGNGGDAVNMTTTKGLPVATNHVFGRAMMFLRSPWATNHIRVMGMQGDVYYQGYVLDAHGDFALEALVDQGGGGSTPLTLDKWVCVEWEFDAPPNGPVVARSWIDGDEILPEPQGYPNVQMLNLWLGYSTALQSVPTEMWVDDVALDLQRVGCPEP